jgi:hypothetical protein
VLGILRHEQRFQPAMMLHAVAEGISDERDVIARFQFEAVGGV